MAIKRLFIVFVMGMMAAVCGCKLDTSNTESLPDRSSGTSAVAESVLSQIETDLLAAGYTRSQVDNVKTKARSRVALAGLESSTDVSVVGPELLRGALDGVMDIDNTDAKVKGIEILTNCLIISSGSVVSASLAGPQMNVTASGPQSSVASYSSLIKTLTAISFEYLDDVGLDSSQINTVTTTVIKGIAANLKIAGVSDENLPSVAKAITQGAVSSLDELGKTDSEKAAAINAITSGTFLGLKEMGLAGSVIATMADEVTAGAVEGLKEAGVDDSNIDSTITSIKTGINSGLTDAGLTAAEINAVQTAIEDAANEGKTSLPLKTITAFSFKATDNAALSSDVTATISGTSITATVPYGTTVTALVATLTIIGESIKIGSTSQVSGTTAIDFTSAVTYTVTGTDALTQNFTVTVSFAARPAGDTDTYKVKNYDDSAWITFIMVNVPGGLTFPTGFDDMGQPAKVDDPYLISQTDVTYELWYTVRNWAASNGYTFANNGREGNDGTIGATPSAAFQEPATEMNWRDSIVWLNALTEYYNEQTGSSLSCVYYYDSAYTTPIRDSLDDDSHSSETPGNYSSAVNPNAGGLDSPYVNWQATGFRLLTSKEWLLAARYIQDANDDGDILDSGEYYPGNHSSGADAKYDITTGASDYDGDGDIEYTTHVAYFPGGVPTTTVASLSPNRLGLYDMNGNVWEYVFDLDSSQRSLWGGGYSEPISYRHISRTAPRDSWSGSGNIGIRFARSQ